MRNLITALLIIPLAVMAGSPVDSEFVLVREGEIHPLAPSLPSRISPPTPSRRSPSRSLHPSSATPLLRCRRWSTVSPI